jgi:DNA-binding LacI/PurR family transcriptional regulator
MNEKIKKYFEINASCLNVRGIELAAGVSPKTLDHFLKGRRTLSEDSAKKIITVIQQIRFK